MTATGAKQVTKHDPKHRSREVTDGPERAPARAMLRAMGLTQEDLEKPFVSVANLASDVTPCNVHLDRLAEAAKEGVRQAGGTPFQFGTITVSDGISMGTEGMKAMCLSGQPGSHRRLHRGGDLWGADGWPDCRRRL